MATPARLTELECPRCHARSWVMANDYPGMDGAFVAYGERTFRCPSCGYEGASFVLLQQSPPHFVLQPHPMYPMRRKEFDHWLGILKTHFPESPLLHSEGEPFRPSGPAAGTFFGRMLGRWRRGSPRSSRPSVAEAVTVRCPLCGDVEPSSPERREGPGAWRPIGTLCRTHAAPAVLPNGHRLSEVVRASRTEVEGPGLGFLLNPVQVGGKQAWTSWFGPAYCVHWPVWRSQDYFEFEALHRPELLDALCTVDQHEEVLRGEEGMRAVHALATTAGADRFAAVQRLCELACRRDRYVAVLQARGKPCADSMAEAYELMTKVEPCTMPPDEIASRIPALRELARRRFAGHVECWAWDFESDRPMAAIRDLFNGDGPWQWIWRDKEAFGPYISAHPYGFRARLYDLDGYHSNGPTYTIEVGVRAPCPLYRPEIDATLEQLLARIGARDVKPGRTYD